MKLVDDSTIVKYMSKNYKQYAYSFHYIDIFVTLINETILR